MKNLKLIFALIAVTLIAGCATVIKGTTQTVNVQSNPDGASVYFDNQLMGKTPFTLEAKKNVYSNIRIEKEGYKTYTQQLTKKYDPITLLSFFWDYSTTDIITGAAFYYEPGTVFIELEAE